MNSDMLLIPESKAELIEKFGTIYVNAPDGFFNEEDTLPEHLLTLDVIFEELREGIKYVYRDPRDAETREAAMEVANASLTAYKDDDVKQGRLHMLTFRDIVTQSRPKARPKPEEPPLEPEFVALPEEGPYTTEAHFFPSLGIFNLGEGHTSAAVFVGWLVYGLEEDVDAIEHFIDHHAAREPAYKTPTAIESTAGFTIFYTTNHVYLIDDGEPDLQILFTHEQWQAALKACREKVLSNSKVLEFTYTLQGPKAGKLVDAL